MKVVDLTKQFKDNSITHRVRRRRLWHWTGGHSANGAITHLDRRFNGKGTVGYNYIIGKDGTLYMLVNPRYGYMQSSGLGHKYDKDTIAIAFVMFDETSKFTKEQIKTARELIAITNKSFHIFEDTHHAHVKHTKRDFPKQMWNALKKVIF